ncbi:stage III sporulation protein AC [Clostridium baratii]|uniref:Stage III sporulation protein AC n=2 Tax=Clostridium baratii TaxID=1561 RepID=A0A0A7FWY3_9CLOT|nr:stage III sporulation protein AC [Clostridium baratii]AIY83296.1 stage III sporulation protein AC [Clostridium baratii str. Sullivan]MBS6006932.1 stage III sporulation protein AC [Clostridium baratii]MDU1053405.1 stage III sporulation protein AC [Clostridium baratii]MDU4910514.1 stage III sporulation protein AC [Clostridium baratii]OPF51589.1 stage III sporulation protein AC [Clostridium baratii]
MLDVSLLLKIGGIGVLIIILDKVLKSGGKDDIAVITNIAGIVIILLMIVSLIGNLFQSVRTIFML